MIIVRTCHRLSFLGGGSDFPGNFKVAPGLVVGSGINKYSYISVRFHPFHTRVVYQEIEKVEKNTEINHRAVKAVLKHVGWEDGPHLEIFHQSDLPACSGTGSSSAFTVGLLNALSALQGRRLSPKELAQQAIHIEQDILEETVGCQDQVFAAYGGLRQIHFSSEGIDCLPLLLTKQGVENLKNHLLLFFTGKQRVSSDVASGYKDKLQYSHNRMVQLAEQSIGAIEQQDFEQLGYLMDQSWLLKSSLPGVTNSYFDDVYMRARLNGAWGGKLTGSGGGGMFLLVVPPAKQEVVSKELINFGLTPIPFSFSFSGSQVIYHEPT
jgi:D-glycero-alpha-D-manno-heptose-7-phosphate kinase